MYKTGKRKNGKTTYFRILGRMIALLAVFAMALTLVLGQISQPVEVEAAAATDGAKVLTGSTTGKELSSGVYYVPTGTTVTYTNNSLSTYGGSGLKIASGATVYIYIPENSTLKATGKNGSGTTGGGAGIWVPSGSKLVFLGKGTVVAQGGRAGDGTDGKNGAGSSYSSSSDNYTLGAGGNGGAGGGGAGAGIGTNGGSGSSSCGIGGYARSVDKDEGISGDYGTSGGNGSRADSMGTLYKATGIAIQATGGAGGTGGSGGSSGGTSYGGKIGDVDRGAAGGAGGGGGGGGLSGASIGTGGGGGGAGGAGGSSGYIWGAYYVGAGGGGAGAGAGSGTGGSYASDSYFGGEGGRSCGRDRYSESGTVTSGGLGAIAWIKSKSGNTTSATGGYGGNGGSAGAAATASSYLTTGAPTTKYNVTFTGATSNATQSYTFGTVSQITAPDYAVGDSEYFIGWQVETGGFAIPNASASGSSLAEGDITFYQPGEVIAIGETTSGNITLRPIVEAPGGREAVSEVLTIGADEFEVEQEYLTYTVKVTVDDNPANIGRITLKETGTESGEAREYFVSSGTGEKTGVYTLTIPAEAEEEAPEFEVYAKNEDTGRTVIAADEESENITELSYETLNVHTKLNDTLSDEPGMVTLSGNDAPALQKDGTGAYTVMRLRDEEAQRVEYPVLVSGKNTGMSVSYGETSVIEYYTVQVTVLGNTTVENVVLRSSEAAGAGNAAALSLQKSGEGIWSLMRQENTVPYTVYVNGMETDITDAAFEGSSTDLRCGLYTTNIVSRLDGTPADGLIETVTLSGNAVQYAGTGSYQSVNVTTAVDPVETRELIADGESEGMLRLGDTAYLDYYTVNYEGGEASVTDVPVDAVSYKKGRTITMAEPGEMTNPGKNFTGWKIGAAVYRPGETVIIQNTLNPTAQWECVSYTISYDMNDRDDEETTADAVNGAGNPTTYTVEDSIVLQNPTREGFLFTGWTYEGQEEPVTDLVIPAGMTGDITFVANWTSLIYTVDASPSELDFGTRIEDYTNVPGQQTVTVTNVGNQSVTLQAPVSDRGAETEYILGILSATTLAPGESAEFTVQPRTGLLEGEHTEQITVATDHGTETSVEVRFLVGVDTTAPTGYIKIGDNQWNILNEDLTFNNPILYGEAKNVTIYAVDEETGVGAIRYYLSEQELSQAELTRMADDEWNIYTTDFTITDNKRYVLYAKLEDREEPANVTYLSSEVFEVDTLPPVIEGIRDGVYYGEQTFTVTDANLQSVKIDGAFVSPDEEGNYTVAVRADTPQTVVASDVFGKTTTVIITVNPTLYTVTYDANGGSGTMGTDSVRDGSSISLAQCRFAAPEGKEFAGWAEGSADGIVSAAGASYTVTEDVTFYATWQNSIYELRYELDGGAFEESAPTSYTIEDGAITLPTPVKYGYDFAGWTQDGNQTLYPVMTIPAGSKGDRTFTAHWTEKTATTYKVNYWQQNIGGDADVTDESNYTCVETVQLSGDRGDVVTPEVRVYEGFTAPSAQSMTLEPTQEQEINYYYTRNHYQLTLVKENGIDTAIGADSYPYGAMVNLTAVAKSGYTFTGYQRADGTLVSADPGYSFEMPANNLTYYVSASPVTYSITYNLDGGSMSGNPDTYTAETDTFTLYNPTRGGYSFAGWSGSISGENVTIVQGTTGDLSFTAQWIPLSEGPVDPDDPDDPSTYATYTVNHLQESLDGNYVLAESQNYSVIAGTDVTPGVRSYTGFTSPGAQTITVSSNGINEVNYNYSRNSYTLTVNCGNGIASAGANVSGSVRYGQPVMLSAAVRDGYTFAGWTASDGSQVGDLSHAFTMPAQDMTYTANAVINTYTINYNLAGGTVMGTNPSSYTIETTAFTLINPTRDGYDFAGWTAENSNDLITTVTIDPSSGLANLSFTANWAPKSNVGYTVRHWKQKVDGDADVKDSNNYSVTETDDTGVGMAGVLVTPPVRDYAGYIAPTAVTVSIAADGSTVVDYYYVRKDFAIDPSGTDSSDKDEIENMIEEIDDLLNDPNLTEEERTDLTNKKNELQRTLDEIEETEENLEDINDRLGDPAQNPPQDAVTEDDRSDLEDLLDDIDDLLDRDPDYLTDEQRNDLLDKRSELQEKLNHLDEVGEDYDEIDEEIGHIPDPDDVSTDDRDLIEDTLDKINDLLRDYPNNLTDDQKNQLEDWKEQLENDLQEIEQLEEQLEDIDDRFVGFDPDAVTADDQDDIQELIDDIRRLLEDEDSHLTETEKQELQDQLSNLRDMQNVLDQIQDDIDRTEDEYDRIPPLDEVKTTDKENVEDLLDEMDDILNNDSDHLTDRQRQELQEKRNDLQERYDKINEIDQTIRDVFEKSAGVPDADDITGEDRDLLEDILSDIDKLLNEEDDHLTDAERIALEEKKEEIEEKYAALKEAKDKKDDADERYDRIPPTDSVTSEDREEIEDLLQDIEELLQYPSLFPSEDVERLQEQKEKLQNDLDKLDAVEDALEDAGDILRDINIPPKDRVTSEDKEEIERLLDELEERLGEYENNLTDEEKKEWNALKEKLKVIQEVEEKMNDIQDQNNSMEQQNLSYDAKKQKIRDLLDEIDRLLNEYGSNLTEAERQNLLKIRDELNKKLIYINQMLSSRGSQGGNLNGSDSLTKLSGKKGNGSREETEDSASEKEECMLTAIIRSGSKTIKTITGLRAGDQLPLNGIPDGVYNLIVTDGTYIENRILIVKDGKSSQNVIWIPGQRQSEVEITEGAPNIASDMLTNILNADLGVNIARILSEGGSAKVKLTAYTPRNLRSVNSLTNKVLAQGKEIAEIFDLDVELYLYHADGSDSVLCLNDTKEIILFAVPLKEEMVGRNGYIVLRSYIDENGKETIVTLAELGADERSAPTREGFYVEDGYVYIWANGFSATYAIACDQTAAVEAYDGTETEDSAQKSDPYRWYIVILCVISLAFLLVADKKLWWLPTVVTIFNLVLGALFCIFGGSIFDWCIYGVNIAAMAAVRIILKKRRKSGA